MRGQEKDSVSLQGETAEETTDVVTLSSTAYAMLFAASLAL